MFYDGHVHIRPGKPEPEELIRKLGGCSLDGALLISLSPEDGGYMERLDNLAQWTRGSENLIPFFWIDPMETGSIWQAREAIRRGVAGFKIICDRFNPGDRECMSVCRTAAEANKPVLFHTGILWDGKPSSENCRPVHFESMLLVEGLRFTLAHIGWPWIDEMVAVYGKFLNFKSRNPESGVEMFIDLTPGTPVPYREEALRKLFTTGYDIKGNLIFGSDCDAHS